MNRARLLSRISFIMLLLALVLAACGRREGPADASVADQEVRVTLHDDFTITASPATMRAGRVLFTIVNEGAVNHGFTIDGQGLEQYLAAGVSLTRETRMPSGTWVIYCPVEDHREKGMQTQLTVG